MAGHVKRRQRDDGSTAWQARIPSPANRHKHIVKTFERKRDAELWLGDQTAALRRGDFIDPRRGETPFAVVADEWRETWADLAPKTRVGYESILNRHVLPAFGRQRVATITPDDVQRFVNALAATRAPNTVRRIMDVLRNVLNLAVVRRYIATSHTAAVRLPGRSNGSTGRDIDISPLTHADLDTLVAALPQPWRLPATLTAYTGLRAGELWALRRRDVDLLRGELSVDEAIKEVTREAAADVPADQRLTDSLVIGPTKTYARRKVSVPSFLRAALAEHLAARSSLAPAAFIFTTATGEPVRHNLFYKRVFVAAVEQAFPGRALRFHDLRHTCAAWLIEAGAHPLQIKLRLGHASIRTTMDTYGHLFPSAEPELADLLDAARRAAPKVVPLRAAS
jgi:integrase